MGPHPERHVGEDDRRQQIRARLEDHLHTGAGVGPDRQVGGDAGAGGEKDRQAAPDEDVAEVAALADLVEIGEQDGHDHARLDAFPEEDHECGEHRVSG